MRRCRSSGVWPPPSPSMVSARPSRWRPPVLQTLRQSSRAAAAGNGSTRDNPSQLPRKIRPSRAPTQGNQNRERARSCGVACGLRGQGALVRKVRARGKLQFIGFSRLTGRGGGAPASGRSTSRPGRPQHRLAAGAAVALSLRRATPPFRRPRPRRRWPSPGRS